ncbi:MAG: glycosyltransferase family 39 protein, partial [Bacteroidales bacterium]|nr:glycosyltransferase family 39 protein [Bacteroidales bacterium]
MKEKFFSFIKKNWILLLIIFGSVLLKVIKITEPFSISWDIAFQGYIAQNHYLHGLANNHFSNVIGYNDLGNIYHLKHPPLIQILIYFSYLIFGISEFSVRIVPIVFSTLSLILLYLIIQEVWHNKKLSNLTVFFFAIIPMSSWFGRVANFQAFVLAFCLLTIYTFLKFKKYRSWTFILFILAICAGCLSDWSYYFVIPGLLLFSILTKQKIKLA